MKIICSNDIKNKFLIIEITEEIDDYTANKIRNRVDFEIEKNIPDKVIFDFNKVTFMDSSGIGMLIGRYKLVSSLGGKLYMMNVRPSVKKIFEISGIPRIIPIIEDVEKAV